MAQQYGQQLRRFSMTLSNDNIKGLTVTDTIETRIAENTIFMIIRQSTGLGKVTSRESLRESFVVDGLHVHVIPYVKLVEVRNGKQPP